MNKFFLPLIGMLFLIGCSDTETDTQTMNTLKDTLDTPKLISNKRPERKEKKEEVVSYAGLDSLIQGYIIELDSLYNRTPYYTKLKDEYIFYVCKGEWQHPEDGDFKNQNILMGIVDQHLNVLLPPAYSKIYNPDGTVKGCIEIELKGKRGLFDYVNEKLLSPRYDVIFPSHKDEFIAIGKKGNLHYGISQEFTEREIQDIPTYIELGKKWNFDIRSQNIKYLYDCYYESYSEDMKEGYGVVFTPSYFYQLGFLPEIVDGISLEENVDFALTNLKGKIEESVSITDKFTALISSFYEEGVDARGWQIDNRNLIVVDYKNNVLGNEQFLALADLNYMYFGEDVKTKDFRFLDNTIFEVSDFVSSREEYSKFDYMSKYKYYKIENDGSIKKLESDRVFDFTKFIPITEDYFKGYYVKFRYSKEGEEEDDKKGNIWIYDHLEIEDLDLMRNEIFAEYGLIFQTPKWQEYFSKQTWYTPKHNSVDQFLTEIDKQNIKVILSVKEKMKGKENEFTKKRLSFFSAAG